MQPQRQSIAWPRTFVKLAIIQIMQISLCRCRKILVYPFDLENNGQFNYVAGVAEILAENGYDVTFLTNSKTIPNELHTDKVSVITYPVTTLPLLKNSASNFLQFEMMGKLGILPKRYIEAILGLCKALLRRKYFLTQLKMEEFDLLILDCSNICGRVLADYLEIPVIVWSSNGYGIACDFTFDCVSSNSPTSQGLLDRLTNVLGQIVKNHFYKPYFIFDPIDEIKDQFGYNQRLSVSETFFRLKPLYLIHINFFIDPPKPIMPYAIPIVALGSENQQQSLSSDVEEFIGRSGENGVIFIHMTFANRLLNQQIKIVVDILLQLDQSLLLQDQLKPIFSNSTRLMFVQKRQRSIILRNNKTKLVITTCNFNSMHEVVQFGIPVIVLSLITGTGQFCQSVLQRSEIGKSINLLHPNREQTEEVIRSLLTNNLYKRNSKDLSNIFNHDVVVANRLLLHWVDHIIQHQGVEKLYGTSAEMKWYQYCSLDIAVLMFFGIIIFAVLSIIFCYFLLKIVMKSFLKPIKLKIL